MTYIYGLALDLIGEGSNSKEDSLELVPSMVDRQTCKTCVLFENAAMTTLTALRVTLRMVLFLKLMGVPVATAAFDLPHLLQKCVALRAEVPMPETDLAFEQMCLLCMP